MSNRQLITFSLLTSVTIIALMTVMSVVSTGKANDSRSLEHASMANITNLAERLDLLEAEVNALREVVTASVGSENAGASSQDDITRILSDISDRWLREISGNLSQIERRLDDINRTLQSK